VRVTEEDVSVFRQFSHDSNPMHVSRAFARRSPFAEPIVHGMLACVAAIKESEADLTGLTGLDVRFHRRAAACCVSWSA
jgi:acyl dehydratase